MQPMALAVGKKAKQNKPQRGETRDDGEIRTDHAIRSPL